MTWPRRVVSVVAILILSHTPGMADGGFFGRRFNTWSPAQKALILQDGPSHEILLLQTTYRGPAADFAWVIPTPGLPTRGDLFPVNADLVLEIEKRTRPKYRQIVVDPLHPEDWRSQGGMAGVLGGKAPAPSTVVVHDRLTVGDYDATILAATGPHVLTGWLNRNGYSFPKEHERILDGYVARNWSFVALRIRSKVREGQPMITQLMPIGIRFATRTLVYPLAISRASAAPVSTLRLFVIADYAVQCRELPTLTFPRKMRGVRGTVYQSMVRSLLARHGGRALLCETRRTFAPLRTPPQRDELYKVGLSSNGGVRRQLMGRIVTRLSGALPKEGLVDLTFTRVDGPRFSLLAEQRLTIPRPRWAYLFASHWGCLVYYLGAYVLAFLAMAVICMRWPDVRVDDRKRDICGSALVILFLVLVSVHVAALKMTPDRWVFEAPRHNLEEFLDFYSSIVGSYPRRLQDLEDPYTKSTALDLSGNPVTIAAGRKWIAVESRLNPKFLVDPFAGRKDTWIYDVTSPRIVESGAVETTVTTIEER